MVASRKNMGSKARLTIGFFALLSLSAFLIFPSLKAQNARFHDAPASAADSKNPYAGQKPAAEAGAKLYAANCAACHGQKGQGTGNIPALAGGPAESANDGELFWFITNGDLNNGMPSWKQLPEQARWQLVTFIKSNSWSSVPSAASTPGAGGESAIAAPPPNPPFTDFRYEKPGNVRKITVEDLPAPYATNSSTNRAKLTPRPANVWPKAPTGFKVDLLRNRLE